MMRAGPLAIVIATAPGLAVCSDSQAQQLTQQTNNTWSGYAFRSEGLTQPAPAPATTFIAVSAVWKQPVVTCPSDDARVSFWVGIDGDKTPTVEQAGTVVICSVNKPPLYQAFLEMFAPSGGSRGEQSAIIAPGDSIAASVIYANGSYALTVQNLTNGKPLAHKWPCGIACLRGTAEWIVERPGKGANPLAHYGAVEFTSRKVTISGADPEHVEITMVAKDTDHTLSACSPAPSINKLPNPPRFSFTADFICKWHAAN